MPKGRALKEKMRLGKDFDVAHAAAMGMKRAKRGENKGHLSSREPLTQAIVKKPHHKTIGETKKSESKLGFVVGPIRKKLVSFPSKGRGISGKGMPSAIPNKKALNKLLKKRKR